MLLIRALFAFFVFFFFSIRRRHTRCALVTGVQTCALPICGRSLLNQANFSGKFDLFCRLRPLWSVTFAGSRSVASTFCGSGPVKRTVEIGRASCREGVCPYV